MKKILRYLLLFLLVLCLGSPAIAQSGKLPPFRMVQANGKLFKAENLPFEKAIILIYFSPECDDCQKLTESILAHIADFKNVSIAMITNLPIELVSKFADVNNLKKYSNIYIGTEGNSLFVKDYYKIEQAPFISLYNKNGDLIIKYSSNEISLNDLLIRLKNL